MDLSTRIYRIAVSSGWWIEDIARRINWAADDVGVGVVVDGVDDAITDEIAACIAEKKNASRRS